MSSLTIRPMRLTILFAVASLLVALVAAAPARAHDPIIGVDPATVDVDLDPGTSTTLTKTVHTPEVLPSPDIYFLADTTGSMGAVLATVRANASAVLAAVDAAASDPRYGAGDYRDFPVVGHAFNNAAPIPAADDDGAAALAAIMAWTAAGGGDAPEAQFYALHRLVEHAEAGFRAGANPIVVWFGDAPGHDPVCDERSGDTGHDVSEASVTSALVSAGVRVIAISTNTGVAGALDANPVPLSFDYPMCANAGAAGQATRIAAATGGVHLTGVAPAQITDAILAGLGALSVEVVPSAACDDPNVTVSWDATSQTVTSGEDATFLETIAAGLAAPQGTTVTCTVDFLVEGELLDGFTQTITVDIADVTAPTVACTEGTNPHGATIPAATNQNPDGFYLLTAEDNVDPDPSIWVMDSGSGAEFGPYPSGTTIKYVEAPGATPNAKTMGSTNGRAGAVTVKITGTGDAFTFAVDDSGNESAAVACLVPPPPK